MNKKFLLIIFILFAIGIIFGSIEIALIANADIPDWMKLMFILK